MPSATPSGRLCTKRADGWIRTSMRRFTRPLPFYFEPHRPKAGAHRFERCRAALETACSPRSTLLQVITILQARNRSIQERHVPHGRSLRLRIHDHLVPTIQMNGAVVRMRNPALHVNTCISTHGDPAELS